VTPRVSVLMAVKDGLPWIREAIESVLSQTYRDFELLLVDDGSVDGTVEAAAAYGDSRLRVLRNDRNLGQVPSLNRGLREAAGAYVARLDADDVCLPERLERQVAVLDAGPAVALTGAWMDVVDERGRLWAKVRGHVRDFPELVFAILSDRYPFAHPSLMYRRDLVLELGGYDESLAPAEDKDLYRRLALARHEVRAVEQVLVRYRRHERQLSQEHRDVQLRHDHEGQERFLSELAGAEHAARLRVLLAQGDGDAELVRLLLDGAERRLALTPAEREKLEELVAGHLSRGHGPLAPGAARLLRGRPLAPLRRLARRSRLLRGLYSRLGAQ
jgi:glycosyltransferase involved in cell wall biosynthesis